MTISPAWHSDTLAVVAGRPGTPGAPLNTPPVFASTYRDGGEYAYGRFDNPTWCAFEDALGRLEAGAATAFASGQAALSTLIETLPLGAVVVVSDSAYLGTRGYLDHATTRGELRARYVDMTDLPATMSAIADADALWIESPTNPLLDVIDLTTLLTAAREQGTLAVVDNTFATPLLQQPLELGAHAVVHSCTKYVGGHSDLLLGAVVTRDDTLREQLRARRTLNGAIPGPMEAWLALRGLRTLPLRLARAQQTAQQLADWLHTHPAVRRTRYPGLSSHPGHDLARRQMTGFGAMLAFELDHAATADRVVEHLHLIVGGTSLGGVETTIDRRHRWPGEERVPPGLLRLSVGLEHADDLQADLDQALTQSTARR